MTPEEIAHQKEKEIQKEIEFYASSVNAWFNTSLEHDKSILTLAAGGIGLLITLLTTVGISSPEALVLYVGAITSFLVALVSVLVVFRSNRTYIEQVLAGKASSLSGLKMAIETSFCSFRYLLYCYDKRII